MAREGTSIDDGENTLSLLTPLLPQGARAGWRALAALELQCGAIRSSTTEPLIGQMRFLWWREAIKRLEHGQPPPVPLLERLRSDVLSMRIPAVDIAALVEPWEMLIEPSGDDQAFVEAVTARGEGLFAMAARLAQVRWDLVPAAGAAWSLAEAASWPHITSSRVAALRAASQAQWRTATTRYWPRPARGLLLPAYAALHDSRRAAAALRTTAFLLTGQPTLLGHR